MKTSLLALAAFSLVALSACDRPAPAPQANAPDATADSVAPSASDSKADAMADAMQMDSAANPAAPTQIQWQCGDQQVTTRFDPDNQNMQLEYQGKQLTLATAPSGSGARYRDAAGNEFWEHQGDARLTLAGGTVEACRNSAS